MDGQLPDEERSRRDERSRRGVDAKFDAQWFASWDGPNWSTVTRPARVVAYRPFKLTDARDATFALRSFFLGFVALFRLLLGLLAVEHRHFPGRRLSADAARG